MIPADLGQLLLLICGFLLALGALIAILDRVESSLYDSLEAGLDQEAVDLAAPVGLVAQVEKQIVRPGLAIEPDSYSGSAGEIAPAR